VSVRDWVREILGLVGSGWKWLVHRDKDEPQHLRTGKWGEEVAAEFLERQGLRVAARRVRVGQDELDIIAVDERTMVFVEVKTRRHVHKYRPAAAVNRRKQRKLSRAAIRYLGRVNPRPFAIRFDILEVVGHPDQPGKPEITHIRRAFRLSRPYEYKG